MLPDATASGGVTRDTPIMPSAAFSAVRCRLSDIDGFTAAVSASACTPSFACTASATVVITSDARRPTIAPPSTVPSSGSDSSLMMPSVSFSITARGLARIRCFVTLTGMPSMRACRSEMPALAISGRVNTHQATPV